jgi:hypothetical protein
MSGEKLIEETRIDDGNDLRHTFHWKVLPTILLIWAIILGGVSFLFQEPFVLLAGGLITFKIGLVVVFGIVRDGCFTFDRFDHDEKLITFYSDPCFWKRRRWIYRIRFKDIAQVRYRKGLYQFVFNDGSEFSVPGEVTFSAHTRHGSLGIPAGNIVFNEVIRTIHRSLVEQEKCDIPLHLPTNSMSDRDLSNSSEDPLRFSQMVVARSSNYDEINGAVLWEGVAKEKRGALGTILGVIWGLSFLALFIWGFVCIGMALWWMILVLSHGSLSRASEEIGSPEAIIDNLSILFVGLMVFLISNFLMDTWNNRLDREFGVMVNSRYWLEDTTPDPSTVTKFNYSTR